MDQLSSYLPDDDRFQAIFDAVHDGLFIANAVTGEIIEVNDSGCRMFGYDNNELIGRNVSEILSSGIAQFIEEMADRRKSANLLQSDPEIFEWQGKTKEGRIFWFEASLRYTRLEETSVAIAVVRDTTERKRLDAEIIYVARHDVLTALVNRTTFSQGLEQAITRAQTTGQRFAVLALDLDHFKDVNDTRGHQVGDHLLSLVAARLRSRVRPNDLVARLGGDEFAILVDEFEDAAEIAALANRLIAAIGVPFMINNRPAHIGASIGAVISSENTRDVETILNQADIALYKAKEEGRGTYRFFAKEMKQEIRSRVALTDELRAAIPDGQLFLVYQPQVTANAGEIVGVEALVRWNHPRRGILLPGDFLEIAISGGLMNSLGPWVMREACRQGQEWLEAGILKGTVSVNLSSEAFRTHSELEDVVAAILQETGFPAHRLELEITETTLINLAPEHGEAIARLRRLGVRFSLDDFGTGYSSLNYLRRFPIDRIKIPREFVSEMESGTAAASIVRLILGLSRDIGSKVIAEGVETQDQLKLLSDWGCHEVQGFYFAKPMSAQEIGALLCDGKIVRANNCVEPRVIGIDIGAKAPLEQISSPIV